MKVSFKRVYDGASKSDGVRILVDRLWPRGVTKEEAHIDVWAKKIAPTPALRTWFHRDPLKRYEEFALKFNEELSKNRQVVTDLIKSSRHVTLVTAVRDIEHSHIPVLVSFIEKL